MIERAVETLPPDVEQDEDGDGDEQSVHLGVTVTDAAGVYRSASVMLDEGASAALIADELIAAVRAVGVMYGGSLGIELAKRLAP